MLSPSDRIVFLPQDREIMNLTGMTEQEYRWFVRECYKNQKLRPGEPVALEPFTISLILTAVSILLSAASMLLAPKPKDEEKPKRTEEQIEGQDVVRRDRFAPKSGFDSFQNVVDMGSVVPIVYCKREEIGGVTYGGLRVNTNLLWSQVLSVGGGQFFRGIFLVGEAPLNLERRQMALGNNTLASYELRKNAEAGRITTYFKNGGRIDKDDYELGVIPANDIGNSDDADVYKVEGRPDFCQALQPSNQVEFGVYGHIGNHFGYKEGEPFVPCSQWQQRSDITLERQNNQQRTAEARKGATRFNTRAGFVGNNDAEISVSRDQELTYKIFRDSDYDLEFRKDGAGSGEQAEAVVNCKDIATSIASEQRAYDELISIGALYKAGSAIVVCTDRTDPFVSEVEYDSSGTGMTAKFKVIEAGKLHVWKESTLNTAPALYDKDPSSTICSEYSQLFRLLVGAFSVERAFETIEVGLQSNVRLQSSSVTNFNSLVTEEVFDGDEGVPTLDGSYQAFLDAVFCSGLDDGGDTDGDAYRRDIRPGTYSSSDTRYSFFRILYRDIDSDNNDFAASTHLYGVRSSTGVDTYNYLRFKFGSSKRREFRFVPVASWEIRSGEATGKLYAIDAHHDGGEIDIPENGFDIEINGEEVERSADTFTLRAFTPFEDNPVQQLGVSPVDDNDSYIDSYARISEAFIYPGVSTTASEPEHKISYVNIISKNAQTPEYDDLAIVGLNIRSSKELRSLDQLSVYVEEGVIDSHLFPDVFKDLLTRDRYGTGEFFSPEQIDTKSFDDAATWTYNRRYFFDGAISEKLNLRTWGAERARDFLLDLSISGGQFTLNPTVTFDKAETIAAMYSSGNILEDSLQVNYFDTQDRLDPIVTVRWREERRDSNIDSKGLFPQIREFSVRRQGVDENAPVIQVDLSNFCTNRQHALDRAKLECQSKRYITHAVNFKTVPTQTGIRAGSIIKLGIETVYYQQPQNGVVTKTGEVTSWPPLADGSHNVLLWDGKTLSSRSMTVKGGKADGVRSAVFCLESNTQKAETYKVSSVSFDEDGNVDVEALYWPTDKNGYSLMTVDWDSNVWDIDG